MIPIVRRFACVVSLLIAQTSSGLVLAADPPPAPTADADPKSPPSEQYRALAQRCAEERGLIMPKGPKGKALEEVESQGKITTFERDSGDFIEKWQRQDFAYSKVLEDMVFQDNSVGKVYPGALVWCNPLGSGRVELVQNPPGRAPVKISAPEAGVNFEHDGTFWDFSSHMSKVMEGKTSGATRIKHFFKSGTSLNESLLRAGFSASVWGSRFAANNASSRLKTRSYCVLSVDQSYFNLVAGEPPNDKSYFDPKSLDNNEVLANYVLSNMKDNCEICYVRRVSYGRRLLVVLNSEASAEQLDAAMSATVRGFGAGFDGKLDVSTLDVWSKTEANGVLIGGAAASGDGTGFFSVVTGDPKDFLATAQKFLTGTSGTNARLQDAVPIAFEVVSCYNNNPVANYETAEFAGEILLKRYRKGGDIVVPAKEVVLNGTTDAKLEQGDWDVGSDDRTNVVVSYSLAVTADKLGVDATVDMLVREMSKDSHGTFIQRPRDTRIRTSHTFRVYTVTDADPNDRRTIASIQTAEDQRSASVSQDFNGKAHGRKTFNNGAVGLLRGLTEQTGLQVEFDGSGDDKDRQHIWSKIGPFTVRLNREGE